jgi:hypothetical protein
MAAVPPGMPGVAARTHGSSPTARSRQAVSKYPILRVHYGFWNLCIDVQHMITASQLRAARALLGIDQKTLAEHAHLSLPTIQRMEASDGVIRGNVDSLTKVVQALENLGIELIGDGVASPAGGRGVRLRERAPRSA